MEALWSQVLLCGNGYTTQYIAHSSSRICCTNILFKIHALVPLEDIIKSVCLYVLTCHTERT